MAAALLPTVMLIGWFVYTWHGLEPPGSQAHYAGFSLAALPMVFSLFGILGVFYATAIWPGLRRRLRESPTDFKPYLIPGMVVGSAAGLAPHTTFDSSFRRSGIWVLARHTPVFFGRSVAIALLTISGALVCGVLFTVLSGGIAPYSALPCYVSLWCNAQTGVFSSATMSRSSSWCCRLRRRGSPRVAMKVEMSGRAGGPVPPVPPYSGFFRSVIRSCL